MIRDPWFWLFLAVTPALFRVLPQGIKFWWVAAASILYVLSISPTSAALALAAAGLAYGLGGAAARHPARRKLLVRTGVFLLLGLLLFWKYTPDIARTHAEGSWFARIAYPVGLSFYVFRLIHYVIEVSRENIVNRDPGTFLAYVMFVPIYTAGPIEQYDHFLANASPRATLADAFEGVGRIAQGLVKKVILADMVVLELLSPHASMKEFLRAVPGESVPEVWTYLTVLFLWGYLDFSAYSDIAIGASRLFGLRIAENFEWPLAASNIRDFWKRWHMSLAAWTQRYVYMPVIAHTRMPYLAVYATFVVMGLWHAGDASYLGWGLYHATGVSVALTWARYKRVKGWGQEPVYLRWWGYPVTWAFVVGSAIFSGTSGHGTEALVMVLRGALGLGHGS